MYDFIPFVSNGWMLHDNYKQSIGSFLGLSTASEKSAAGPWNGPRFSHKLAKEKMPIYQV